MSLRDLAKQARAEAKKSPTVSRRDPPPTEASPPATVQVDRSPRLRAHRQRVIRRGVSYRGEMERISKLSKQTTRASWAKRGR